MTLRLRHVAAVLALASLPLLAQERSSSSKPHAKSREKASPDAGSINDGVYRNQSLSFSYKIPLGWVDRTADMREGSELGKSLVLLAIFERPLEAQAEGVNSAVVIAAENVSSYPGLKTAADYFGPLTELTTGKGFKVESDPQEFSVGAKQVVRGDFSKPAGAASVRQTSLVFLEKNSLEKNSLEKNWIISFTFIGSSEDEIDELLEKLSFAGASSKSHPSK
jgi:hypothetical protein